MTKTVLVAHRNADVRERFATALVEAGQRVLIAGSPGEVARLADAQPEWSLVLIDAAVAGPLLERGTGEAAPAMAVFAGTVDSAAQARLLAAAGVRAWVNDHSAPHQVIASLAPLLFHDSFNRRAGPRVPVAFAVSCDVGGTVSSATALNLGHGGIALRPLTTIPVGTVMAIRFHAPVIGRDITAEVRVCWTDARLGLGAQFERISEQGQRAVDALVESQLSALERR